MREIKFRGMSIKGEWHIGNLAITKTDFNGVEMGHYISNSVGRPFAYHVRPETVGQFIGLKDKNQKDIYEGDVISILTQNGRIETFEVKWDIHRRDMRSGWTVDIPGFSFVTDEGFPTFPIVDNYQGVHDLSMIEVLGNIYEHPELLNPTTK